MTAWIYILIASLCQTFWASSLKLMNFQNIKIHLKRNGIFSKKFAIAVLPLCTYVIFGILNMVFLTMALKTISLAITYAVWMGVGLVIQALIDIFYFKEKITKVQAGSMMLILIGVAGLQMTYEK